MAYLWETQRIKLPERYDRRRTITPAARERAKKLLKTGKHTLTAIAERTGMSIASVYFIANPKMCKQEKNNARERMREYNRTVPTKYKTDKMREHRRYKQEILTKLS